MRLIERDEFEFEFLSRIAERESWRKEIHRPIYHVHKWWAKRLGSVFRGILLGAALKDEDLKFEFYRRHDFSGMTVLDPFMGSGTTVGEAHKLGFSALGRDINPVAVESVKSALGPMDRMLLKQAFAELSETVGARLKELYRSRDSKGRPCDVLYYFWVMQAACPDCDNVIDLFSSYVIASNAYPSRKPEIQVVCPECGDVFPSTHGMRDVECRSCHHRFDPENGPVSRGSAKCKSCGTFKILNAIDRKRPTFRLYAKLVLNEDGQKEYLPATAADHDLYEECRERLKREEQAGSIELPSLDLQHGYNTKQAMSYGFLSWRDFFNDRQLLALGYLRAAIQKIPDTATRRAMLTLFSGTLEFNNMFASYKGEGTGAVRHMFAHHILKPERVPIEANVWGTPKSSGSFSGLFRSRLLRAFEYRFAPTEIPADKGSGVVCSAPFTGNLVDWPKGGLGKEKIISLSCGDSASIELPTKSVDLVVTDPPFFDNVHYSELADFFYAWHQPKKDAVATTRNAHEVQDTDAHQFARKLAAVFSECNRVMKDDGLLIFTYHHSREDGWSAVAEALLEAGFVVVNTHPVKSEMSVATPKAQASEPIQLDIVIVCRKCGQQRSVTPKEALRAGWAKLKRLEDAGFKLSRGDRRVVLRGQLLTAMGADREKKENGEWRNGLFSSAGLNEFDNLKLVS